MRLDINGTTHFDDVDEEDVLDGLDLLEEGGASFAVLSSSDRTYVQALGTPKEGFHVEQRDGSVDQHYACTGEAFTLQEVRELFLLYLSGNDRWRTEYHWIPIEVDGDGGTMDSVRWPQDVRSEGPSTGMDHPPEPSNADGLVLVIEPGSGAELSVVESVLEGAGIGFVTNLPEETPGGRSRVETTGDLEGIGVWVLESDRERARAELRPRFQDGLSSTRERTNHRLHFLVGLTLTLLILATGAERKARAQERYFRWEPTEARIVYLGKHNAEYRYSLGGEVYEGRRPVHLFDELDQVVEIRYNPEDPTESTVKRHFRLSATTLHRSAIGLLGSSVILMGLVARSRQETAGRPRTGDPDPVRGERRSRTSSKSLAE